MGEWKLIDGSPGRYNNWYKAKSRPSCNFKEAQSGYMQEERQLWLDEQATRRLNRSWMMSLMGNLVNRAAQATGASNAWNKINLWYEQIKCDRFKAAHRREEKSIVLPRIQLFNLRRK